jgi:hypothetical protein
MGKRPPLEATTRQLLVKTQQTAKETSVRLQLYTPLPSVESEVHCGLYIYVSTVGVELCWGQNTAVGQLAL